MATDGNVYMVSDVGFVFLHVMSGVPSSEAGDGHEHGCLDALAIAFGSSSEDEHLNFQLFIKQLREAGLHSAEDLALAGRGDNTLAKQASRRQGVSFFWKNWVHIVRGTICVS